MHVLLIEDNKPLCDAVTTYLESYGIQVYSTADKKEARKIIASGIVDAIILDSQLGSCNSACLLRKLQAQCQEIENLPIIITTAYEQEALENFGVPGLKSYRILKKPYSLPKLRQELLAVRSQV